MAKILLKAQGIRKAYGERELLRLDTLEIREGERIGLIGANGAGKSTLLALLAGEAEPDTGTVERGGSVAWIRQQGRADRAEDPRLRTRYRALEERDGLSGGEETRRRIAAALSEHAELLLADEPTSDLDEAGIALLREELRGYPGAWVLVSHDRTLLRALCGRIWLLEDGKILDFPGGYDAMEAERQRRREFAQFEYEQYRREQARLEESARRAAERASQVRKAPSRMGNSEARLHKREATDAVLRLSHTQRTIRNRMEQMEVKDRPREDPQIRMQMGVAHPIGARTALEVRCERLSAGDTPLLEETAFTLPTGSRTALLGPNGCGKSTLMSVLCGQAGPEVRWQGSVRWNPQARLGWFDQHHSRTLRMDWTVLENVTAESVLPEHQARTVLRRLGFSREDCFKRTELLSGGERAKAALARLLLLDCNVLLLDEPTNYLDVFTLEALESLLAAWAGTLLVVSHDETFVGKTANRLLRVADRRIQVYEGTVTEERRDLEAAKADQELRLARTGLEMRLAALAARLAAPRKGDRPEQLNEEYLELARQLRELKKTSLPS